MICGAGDRAGRGHHRALQGRGAGDHPPPVRGLLATVTAGAVRCLDGALARSRAVALGRGAGAPRSITPSMATRCWRRGQCHRGVGRCVPRGMADLGRRSGCRVISRRRRASCSATRLRRHVDAAGRRGRGRGRQPRGADRGPHGGRMRRASWPRRSTTTCGMPACWMPRASGARAC